MPEEIELKLALDPAWVERFKQHELLAGSLASQPQQRQLINTYFDTPEQQLNRHAVALRVRSAGGRFVQTLKTRGDSRGGLHQRHEWEWEVSSPNLDVALLPDSALPVGVDLAQLEPAFRTDFQRTRWLINWQGNQIELVLDQGAATRAGLSQPISEIELELKSGSSVALFEVAASLAVGVPLHLCDVSKAERGYRLADPSRGSEAPVLASKAAPFDERVQRALRVWAWALDRYQFESSAVPLRRGVAALGQLQDLIASEPRSMGLSQAQIEALDTWRGALAQAVDEATLSTLLDDAGPARSLLRVAAWLNRQ